MTLKTLTTLATLLIAFNSVSLAQTPATVRLRGTIDTIDAENATVTTREGAVVKLALGKNTQYSFVKAMKLSDIQPGSFIGAAGRPAKDGTIEALEVVVFPEARRGTGEGHFAWDLLSDSSMTNATVAAVAQSNTGNVLNLVYKDGTKKVMVSSGIPIVTIVEGKITDVHPGLPVFIVAAPKSAAEFTVLRLVVGKDGVAPPM